MSARDEVVAAAALVERWDGLRAEATLSRDDAIVRWHREGSASLREIAAAAGISHSMVVKIVNRGSDG